MIGRLNDLHREVTVVGAGISGLLVAYHLDRRGYYVTLLEEKERAGGLLRTDRTRFGIAEAAANSMLASPAVRELCNELGVELSPLRADSRARYILRGDKLRKFPLSVTETAGALRRAAFNRAGNHGETQDLESWGTKHLGEAAVNYLLNPFVRGIYGVKPREVGLIAAFPNLFVEPGKTLLASLIGKRIATRGSKKPRSQMVAPVSGMGEFVSRLEEHLRRNLRDRFVTGITVPQIPDVPNVVVTIPAYRAADLFENSHSGLAERLRTVEYTPMVSVTAFIQQSRLSRNQKGVGVLVPGCEKRTSLGVLFSSSSFVGRVNDESKYASFTVMMGGSSGGYWVTASDEEIRSAVTEDLGAMIGLTGELSDIVINRWPLGIPKYSTELPLVWKTAEESWCSAPGHVLFGNYTGQVSLRGMIESVSRMC